MEVAQRLLSRGSVLWVCALLVLSLPNHTLSLPSIYSTGLLSGITVG